MFFSSFLNAMQYVIAVLAFVFLTLKISSLVRQIVRAELMACNVSLNSWKKDRK